MLLADINRVRRQSDTSKQLCDAPTPKEARPPVTCPPDPVAAPETLARCLVVQSVILPALHTVKRRWQKYPTACATSVIRSLRQCWPEARKVRKLGLTTPSLLSLQ